MSPRRKGRSGVLTKGRKVVYWMYSDESGDPKTKNRGVTRQVEGGPWTVRRTVMIEGRFVKVTYETFV